MIKAIEEHVKRQNNNFKFIYGREVITKQQFLVKLKDDKEFRQFIVNLVCTLSIEMLERKGG